MFYRTTEVYTHSSLTAIRVQEAGKSTVTEILCNSTASSNSASSGYGRNTLPAHRRQQNLLPEEAPFQCFQTTSCSALLLPLTLLVQGMWPAWLLYTLKHLFLHTFSFVSQQTYEGANWSMLGANYYSLTNTHSGTTLGIFHFANHSDLYY